MLASETNGAIVLAPGDLEAGMRRILSDSSGYYVLTFRPAHADDIGTFHPIQLRVKRANVTVRTRTGYWSTSGDDLFRAWLAAKAVEPKVAPTPPTHASPLIRPWFGVARAGDGTMQVRFVWEPVAPVPGDRVYRQAPTRVVLRAWTIDGTKVAEDEVEPVNPAESAIDPRREHAVFDVSPGRLRVQLAIEDAEARLLDTDVRDVIVGALAGPVEVGTAEVLRTRNAREFRALDTNPDAVPVASREFSRSERLLIRIPVYGSSGVPSVSASLLSKVGRQMRALSIEPGPAANIYQIDLPLASLAAGEYEIEISAKDASGTAGEKVNFRVTP